MEDFYFTQREKTVISLVMEGLTNREIGERLFISVHTVKSIMENIYYKTECHNRVQLIIFVLKNNVEIETSLL